MSETISPRAGGETPSDLVALARLLQSTAAALVALTQESAASTTSDRLSRLTPAELRIAGLVRQGHTNEQVARRVRISPHTVNFHLRQVYRKLGISSRVQLAGLPWPYTLV